MAWICIGNATTADVVVEKLNDLETGSSVTISLDASKKNFVVWVDKTDPGDSTWKNLGQHGSQEEVANVMDSKGLGPNNAVVSVDATGKWQLWGFMST